MTQEHSKKVFISCSSKDAETASRICRLIEQEGVPCWIAPRDIDAGANYAEEILRGLRAAEVLVILISGDSNESEHVKREVERAVSYRKAILPIKIQDVPLSEAFEYFLSTCQITDAYAPPLEEKLKPFLANLKKTVNREKGEEHACPAPSPGPREGTKEESVFVEFVSRGDLAKNDVVFVDTASSCYRIEFVGGSLYSVSGGWFDKHGPSPREITITGCVSRSPGNPDRRNTEHIAAVGKSICFGNGPSEIVTSPVTGIRVKKT